MTNKITIGDWVFDPITHQLCQQGQDAAQMLENRQAQLLLYLCQSAGRDVTKNELLELWRPRVVNEDALYVAVAGLRKALGDDSRLPKYIKTLPGVGYRLVAPVADHAPPKPGVAERASSSRRSFFVAVTALAALGAAAISALTLGLGPEVKPLPEALAENYRRARYLLGLGSEHHAEAMILLRQIMAAAPNHPDAYALAAHAFGRQLSISDAEALVEVNGWIDRALILAPEHTLAHLARANLLFLVYWQIDQARAHFEASLASAESYLSYASYLLAVGEFEQALAQVHRYQDLAPEGYGLASVAWIHAMSGRNDAALIAIDRLHALDPTNPYYHVSRQGIFEARGEFAAAFEELRWLMTHAGYAADELDAVTNAFGQGGLPSAYAWLAEVDRKRLDLGQYRPPLSLARYLVGAGQHERALDFLQQAVNERQVEVLWLAADPKYRPLRSHPRFRALLQAIGLPLPQPQ